MRNTEWPKDEVQRLAKSSGKPLEVTCAQQFLSAGWKARLGSYFTEGELKTLRELDVLAEKEEVLPRLAGAICRVRVVVSCKGFPPERSPLAYSVSTGCVPSHAPCLLSSHREHHQRLGSRTSGPLPDLEAAGADVLLRASSLHGARPLVAFDMLERKEETRRKGKDQIETTVEFNRCGDKPLFAGIDSCIKAAFYWMQQDYSCSTGFVALNVPVCVLSAPFWDVCIDDGTVGETEIRQRGYQTNLYPSYPGTQEVMSLVWAAEEMSKLVNAVDSLFGWFRDKIQSAEYAALWAASK
jgi:hypothetical protein